MPPTLGNGKICYLEIPAGDLRRSIDFCQRVFGWQISERGDGQVTFDDAVGEVSGTWVTGRPSSPEPDSPSTRQAPPTAAAHTGLRHAPAVSGTGSRSTPGS
jgi:predicted enzyme related to lactoylglutathione lyase